MQHWEGTAALVMVNLITTVERYTGKMFSRRRDIGSAGREVRGFLHGDGKVTTVDKLHDLGRKKRFGYLPVVLINRCAWCNPLRVEGVTTVRIESETKGLWNWGLSQSQWNGGKDPQKDNHPCGAFLHLGNLLIVS
jgi:hypothetical protein